MGRLRSGWVDQDELDELPRTSLQIRANRIYGHFSQRLNRYVQVQFAGFPLSPIGLRTAQSLTGPWTALEEFYSPEEITGKSLIDESELLLYAAKAHPELASRRLGFDLLLQYF